MRQRFLHKWWQIQTRRSKCLKSCQKRNGQNSNWHSILYKSRGLERQALWL